jgi:hypothetical protein
LADAVVGIDSKMLEAWIITSKVIYEHELSLTLPIKKAWRALEID